MTTHEETELYIRTGQAWELRQRGSPYYVDACEEIAAWHERRRLAQLEREHDAIGRIVRLLREVNAA
jgi:hypothetical protein